MARAKKTMIDALQIQQVYIDYVLTHNERPKSVYSFAKILLISEAEFYHFYASFTSIESSVWSNFLTATIEKIKEQNVWNNFSSREKVLSFFYGYFEQLGTQRSFVIFSLSQYKNRWTAPAVLLETKHLFEDFAEQIVQEGLASKELADRRFLSKKYKDALWVQFSFILKFWIADTSIGFEKTDEAIEKGINVSFELFAHSQLDDIIEYGKFLFRSSNLKDKLGI